MFFQAEVSWVDEMHNWAKPARLGREVLLDVVSAGQDDGPDDANHVRQQAEKPCSRVSVSVFSWEEVGMALH